MGEYEFIEQNYFFWKKSLIRLIDNSILDPLHHDIFGFAPGGFVVLVTRLPDPHGGSSMARLGKQVPSSLYGPVTRRRLMKVARAGEFDTPDRRKKTDRRRGKKDRYFLHGLIAHHLPTKSSRTRLSDISEKRITSSTRRVVKVNHGIVEIILLVLFAGCLLLATILLLR